MKQKTSANFISWRFYFIVFFLMLIIFALAARLIDLSLIKQNFLRNESNARILRVVTVPAFRGMITDRNSYPLAISTQVYSAWVNPQTFANDSASLKMLSGILLLSAEKMHQLIQKAKIKKREFLYLKRNLSPQTAKQIQSFKLSGIYLQEEFKRYYPEGEVSSQLIGFTNVDDQGQEGLELSFNNWLTGTPGKKMVIKDRDGRVISDVKAFQEQIHGNDLVLSIDKHIQYLAYRELAKAIQEFSATSGSIVVLDVKTGEILAMVNQPSFNPNNRIGASRDSFRNRAVIDVFEPGSTIKAFSIASALDSGQYTPDSMIDTHPGWLRVGHNLVRDEHNKGVLSVTQILQVSSNVGVTKIILSLPQNQLWSLLHRVGFGEETGIGFPGERSGALINRSNWKPFALATMAFGYGISTTPLQLAEAYSVIANDGIKIPVSLFPLKKIPQGKRVMDAKIAEEMLTMLQSVTKQGGTAKVARVQGYTVAGKTGTARLLGPNGYLKNHHVSSFVGIAPASAPRLVVAVVIHDPQGKLYHGGDVAAPAFEKVMEGTLRILNIPPDDQSDNKTTH